MPLSLKDLREPRGGDHRRIKSNQHAARERLNGAADNSSRIGNGIAHTCRKSRIVSDGFVTEPDPPAIGAGLARLLASPADARRLGENGFEAVRHIGWDPVVEALTETLR